DGSGISDFQVDPKGKSVAYLSDEDEPGNFRLNYVDLKKGLSKPIGSTTDDESIDSFYFDSAGKYLVYSVGNDVLNSWNISRTDIKKNTSFVLSPPPEP